MSTASHHTLFVCFYFVKIVSSTSFGLDDDVFSYTCVLLQRKERERDREGERSSATGTTNEKVKSDGCISGEP